MLSNGPDKKERTKGNEHVKVQKGANITIVMNFWLVQTSNFNKSSQSNMYINPSFSKQLPCNKILEV